MDLQSWETYADGTAVNGATVQAYLASGTNLVPPGAVVASTTTNAQGYWSLTGLAEAAHDVKITLSSQVRWYKGLTQFSVKSIIGDNFTPLPANMLRNSGFEFWRSFTTITNSGTDYNIFAECWEVEGTAGDTIVLSRESGTIASNSSKYSAKIIYTKVGAGPATIYQGSISLAPGFAQELRGKTIYASIQCRQGVGNNVTPYLGDGVGTTTGSTSATTGSFVTLSVSRVLNSAATKLVFGVQVASSDTIYLDNAVACISAVLPTYVPHVSDGGSIGSADMNTHVLPLAGVQLFLGAN